MSGGFWDVDGEIVESSTSVEVEGGGGSPMPIPAGTQVKAVIGEVKWETTERSGTFIFIKWEVTAPECYAGRKINQKIHVRCHEFATAPDFIALTPEKLKAKRMAALRMLAAIDGNAGGKIHATQKAPDDIMLQKALMGSTQSLGLDVFEMTKDTNGQSIQNAVDYFRGNWVRKVDPKAVFRNLSKEEQEAAVAKTDAEYKRMLEAAGGQRAPRESSGHGGGGQQRQQQAPQQQRQAADFDSFDDDIPF